jgi:crossover junction endodeoxyribonuclease RusA
VTSWVLTPPWHTLPVSLNHRQHWAAKARAVADCRVWAGWAAKAAHIPPLRHAVVELVWYAPDRRRRDADQPVGTLKPCCDGLVDAGVVPDDTPEWMTKLMPRIEYRKNHGGVALKVTGDEL